MMGHTPGPWVVRPAEDDELVEVYREDGGDLVAYAANNAARNYNASLMAAAPEMLDALKRIAHRQFWGDGAFSVAELCNTLIEKAEGRGE